MDWIHSIKTRELPICDVETGHRSATVCHLANIAYDLGIPLKWNPVKERFNDRKANRRLNKKYRKPYRSEEHTSELQSLMRTSYAVFCLKKKKQYTKNNL